MDVRSAEDDDAAAIARIAAANDEQEGADPRYVAHQRRHGRFLVAEVDGQVAGYCATRRIGAATMLCDLFIDPCHHGRGAGRRLLDDAFPAKGDRFTFASQDPRAMPLYLRHGMAPRWPLLYLSGPPAGGSALRADRVAMADAGDAEAAMGCPDRTADYAYWGAAPGSTGLIVRIGDDIVAAGAAAPGRLIHLTTAGGHDPAAALLAALGAFEDDRVRLCLPGPHPAVPLLLERRWRIDAYDHHMSSSPGLITTDRVLSPSLC
jgi:GNAT superfamily N-acetyltransferase